MGNKLSFENKLLKYSVAAGAVLIAQEPLLAGVVVTDPADRTISSTGDAPFTIDFNSDGTDDLKIYKRLADNIYASGYTTNVRFLGTGPAATHVSFQAYALNSSKSIPVSPTGNAKWGKNSFGNNVYLTYGSGTFGAWANVMSDKYLGVKFKIGANTHYGWVQMSVPSTGSITIQKYAYNDTPDQGIGSPLPVELVSFNALQVENAVKLLWTTATELNNYGFDIERAALDSETDIPGGDDWEKIGFVPGNGNSNSPKHYEFSDSDAPEAYLYYRLKQIDTDGSYEYFNTTVNIDNSYNVTAVKENGLPVEFVLEQNYPNPFNPDTRIKFSIAEKGFVKLSVFNSIGEKVAELVNGNFDAGNYEVEFNAGNTANGVNLPSGIYIYRLQSGDKYTSERKMALLK